MNPLHYFLLCAIVSPLAKAQHQTVLDPPLVGGTLPYSITLRETSLAPAPIPTLHSVAAAKWDGHWILLAGRTSGLHGLTGQNAFDPHYENRSVWIIDPVNKQSWSKTLLETNTASGLATDVVDSLSSVNTQFHQTGDRLIVVGGYGCKRSAAPSPPPRSPCCCFRPSTPASKHTLPCGGRDRSFGLPDSGLPVRQMGCSSVWTRK